MCNRYTHSIVYTYIPIEFWSLCLWTQNNKRCVVFTHYFLSISRHKVRHKLTNYITAQIEWDYWRFALFFVFFFFCFLYSRWLNLKRFRPITTCIVVFSPRRCRRRCRCRCPSRMCIATHWANRLNEHNNWINSNIWNGARQ